MAGSNHIDTRYLKKEEYDQWDSFVDQARDGTIFHKSIWLKPIAEWQHLNFSIIASFKGGKLTGGMAFTWKKKFGMIPVIQMPLKTPFFGPVISCSDTKYLSKIESQVHSATKVLTDFLMSEYQLFQAQFPPSFTDVRPYVWNGFEARIHYTYNAELNREMDIQAAVDPDIRRRIKKALQSAHEIHEESTGDFIALAWELEQKSFERQKFSMSYAGKEQFVAFIKHLVQNDSAQVFTITYEKKPVASVIIIQDTAKGIAYYWLAGADREYLNTGMNQLLLVKILEKYQQSDINRFDLVGADTESIARYKSTINLPLVPSFSVHKSTGMAKLGLLVKKYIP